MFKKKLQRNKTHILGSITVFSKIVPFIRQRGKIL